MQGNESKTKARRLGNPEAGFSMVELVIATAVILTVSAIAIIQIRPALQAARSDAAMREVVDQLRQAREYAITNRRYVQVSFPLDSSGRPAVQIQEMNTLTPGGGSTNPVLSLVTLEGSVAYTLVSGMNDTPDGFGNAYAVEFEGANAGSTGSIAMYFESNGELVDGTTLAPINGTVFLGTAGSPMSARAVTVLGTTGRVRGWKSNGISNWTQF
jgi:Tfp pilus assembly protein FimT